MGNPFDDQSGSFRVLVNAEGQYSLWPAFIRTPDGWTAVLEEGTHRECLEYIESSWTDMRPASLRE